MPGSVSDKKGVAAEKRRLAKAAREGRAEAKATTGPLAGDLLMAQFLAHVEPPPAAAVAGYWPMNDEISPVPLLRRLFNDGVVCALPAVVTKGEALLFRQWQPDLALDDGPFGTSHPPASAGEVTPGVVLVPLLAFDPDGYRVGYGGGYYDRTLAALRAREPGVLAVGLAYESQAIEAVPRAETDERLDWVITENGAHRFP